MRAAIAHHLLSGEAIFTAGAILVVVLALELAGPLDRSESALRVARISFLLAIGLGALSGTPLPWWIAASVLAALGAVASTGLRGRPTRASRLSAALALALVLAALALEFPHHRSPRIALPSGRALVVLGDSLSSGGFGESAAWPERIGRERGIEILNLALAGETVASALVYQVPRLVEVPPESVLIIEIGGNDLLGDTRADRFEETLDRLLAEARRSPVSGIAMFELPLPPGRWRWGAIQRRLARRHGVILIPKRILARVLTDRRLVTDGLHLRDAGHERLAREISAMLARPGSGE
ncbi:MAG TPA: GDSL-type esterase/lipase family protein [Thermoanaerobaculia bacterium]|nr:GDSL-type esterase/lipase family protein [Thermoanaerobaculia bacterium]